MRIWGACTLAVILNAAMVSDIVTGKIRNRLIVPGLALGLIYQIHTWGAAGLGNYAGAVLLALAATFPMFAFGAIGAGDSKLLAVAGGFLGMRAVPLCLLCTFLIGAVQAFLKMLWQKSLIRRMTYLAEYLKRSLHEQTLGVYGQSFQEEEAVIHLSAAVLFASLICLIGGVV